MGEYNCAALICCPPGAESQQAIANILIAKGCDPEYAKACAPFIQDAFDLMPPGSLKDIKATILKMHETKRDKG